MDASPTIAIYPAFHGCSYGPLDDDHREPQQDNSDPHPVRCAHGTTSFVTRNARHFPYPIERHHHPTACVAMESDQSKRRTKPLADQKFRSRAQTTLCALVSYV